MDTDYASVYGVWDAEYLFLAACICCSLVSFSWRQWLTAVSLVVRRVTSILCGCGTRFALGMWTLFLCPASGLLFGVVVLTAELWTLWGMTSSSSFSVVQQCQSAVALRRNPQFYLRAGGLWFLGRVRVDGATVSSFWCTAHQVQGQGQLSDSWLHNSLHACGVIPTQSPYSTHPLPPPLTPPPPPPHTHTSILLSLPTTTTSVAILARVGTVCRFGLGSVVSVGSVQGGTSSKGCQVSVGIRSLSCALLALNSVVCLWRRRCRTYQKGQASILRRRRMKRRMAFTIRWLWCRAWWCSCLGCQGLWL